MAAIMAAIVATPRFRSFQSVTRHPVERHFNEILIERSNESSSGGN